MGKDLNFLWLHWSTKNHGPQWIAREISLVARGFEVHELREERPTGNKVRLYVSTWGGTNYTASEAPHDIDIELVDETPAGAMVPLVGRATNGTVRWALRYKGDELAFGVGPDARTLLADWGRAHGWNVTDNGVR